MRAPLLLILPLLWAGCGAPPAAPGTLDQAAWEKAFRRSAAAAALGDWDGMARECEARVAAYPAPLPPSLRGSLQGDLYDLACARALAGRPVAALDALEQALADGVGIVGFDHLVRDPDLASLRAEPRWEALIARLSSLSEYLDGRLVESEDEALKPCLVFVQGDGVAIPETWPPSGSIRVARPRAPYVRSPESQEWATRLERGERAAAVISESPGFVSLKGHSRPVPAVLVALGPEGIRLAWEVLLRRPDAFRAAIFDGGPAPPAWALLDRGAERVKTRLIATSKDAAPDASVGVQVAIVPTVDAALAEALR